jgi:hypothetical protein
MPFMPELVLYSFGCDSDHWQVILSWYSQRIALIAVQAAFSKTTGKFLGIVICYEVRP